MTDKRFRLLIANIAYVTIGYMQPEDIIIGAKVRCLVGLSDIPAGSIGIVTQIADKPWRFWLCWPCSGFNRYSMALNEDDFRHFELIQRPMSEGECSVVNYDLSEIRKPTPKNKHAGQLSLPLSDWEI